MGCLVFQKRSTSWGCSVLRACSKPGYLGCPRSTLGTPSPPPPTDPVSPPRVLRVLAAAPQGTALVGGWCPPISAQGQSRPLPAGPHGDREGGPGADGGAGEGQPGGLWGEFGPPTPPLKPHSPLHPQIGSYFGSELLALDLEGDGDSDLLLVAAPTYLGGQSRETGKVYVYRVGQVRGCGGGR